MFERAEQLGESCHDLLFDDDDAQFYQEEDDNQVVGYTFNGEPLDIQTNTPLEFLICALQETWNAEYLGFVPENFISALQNKRLPNHYDPSQYETRLDWLRNRVEDAFDVVVAQYAKRLDALESGFVETAVSTSQLAMF